jgi:hypothetical protein
MAREPPIGEPRFAIFPQNNFEKSDFQKKSRYIDFHRRDTVRKIQKLS